MIDANKWIEARRDRAKNKPIAVAVIKDCVLTKRRIGWCNTNKTGKHNVLYSEEVRRQMFDGLDQRLLFMVDVRMVIYPGYRVLTATRVVPDELTVTV